MARALKLKVYRTPIGFHDAYVAAPSQKAAMEAWGSGKDLFTRGEAELVTDPALTAEPLAQPGVVIKKLRATAEEQIAALPPDKPKPRKEAKPAAKSPARRNPVPRPSRAALDAAEQALDVAEARHAEERERLAERERELERERRDLDKRQAEQRDQLADARDRAAAAFEQALREWRG